MDLANSTPKIVISSTISMKRNKKFDNTNNPNETVDKNTVLKNDFISIKRKSSKRDDSSTANIETKLREEEILKSSKIDLTVTTDERVLRLHSNDIRKNPVKIDELTKKTDKKRNSFKLFNWFTRKTLNGNNSVDDYSKIILSNKISSPLNTCTKKFDLKMKKQFTDKSVEKLNLMIGNSKLHDSKLSEDKKVCKICYEGEEEKKILLTPCLCQGSMKYIHETCLKKWIEEHTDMESPECEICKFKYKLKWVYKYRFCKKKFWYTIKSISIIIVVVTIILILILSITYVIIGTSLNLSENEKSFTALILLLIVGLVNFFVCLYFCKNFRKNFFYKETCEWKIENNSFSDKNFDFSKSSNNIIKPDNSVAEA